MLSFQIFYEETTTHLNGRKMSFIFSIIEYKDLKLRRGIYLVNIRDQVWQLVIATSRPLSRCAAWDR